VQTLPLGFGGLGMPELLIILAVVVLLFGASKLPKLARIAFRGAPGITSGSTSCPVPTRPAPTSSSSTTMNPTSSR
jgi:sec-independent protein translocase protein TatA